MQTSRKPPSQRQLKVGEEIRHALSEIFIRGDFYDPETNSAITVTISEVRISPDLSNATAFVMPLGGKDLTNTMNSLEKLSPKIRSLVSKKVRLRRVPSIYFKLDDSFIKANEINDLLNKPDVKADVQKDQSKEQ